MGMKILALFSPTITVTNSNIDFQLLLNDQCFSQLLIILELGTDGVSVAHIRFITELKVMVLKLSVLSVGKI